MNLHRPLVTAALAFAGVAGVLWPGGAGRAYAQPGAEVAVSAEPDPTLWPAPSIPSFWYMDFGVRAASAPDGTLMVEPAIELARSMTPYLGLGLGFSTGSAPLVSGERHAFTIAPSVDLHRRFFGRVRGHARVGVAAQHRGGGRLPDGESLALFGALGARLNLGLCLVRRPGRHARGCLTAGTEVRLQRAMTGGWLMNPAVLPRGASILSTSVTLGWEV